MSGKTMHLAIVLLVLACWSNPSPSSAQGIYANYIPHFPTNANNLAISADEAPLTTLWLGGDGAIETRLDASHSLWFFADSLISNNRRQGRYNGVYPNPGTSMNYSTAHNTIAIATHLKTSDRYTCTRRPAGGPREPTRTSCRTSPRWTRARSARAALAPVRR